jgi:hypothetical protein
MTSQNNSYDRTPMWDDDEETTPDHFPTDVNHYLTKEQLDTFVTFNIDGMDKPGCKQMQTGDKESRERFQTVSPNATTLDRQGLFRVNLTELEDKEGVKKQMKDGFHDLIATYLTSEFMDGRTFDPSEVAQAFRDALMDEAQWHQKQAARCEQFRQAISKIPAPPRE